LPNVSIAVRKNINILQSSNRYKQIFPSPPVVAYKRSPSLPDLLVRSALSDCSIQQEKPSPGVSKCNHPRCLTCQADYTFTSTQEKRRIHDPLNCNSKNLVYLIECKKCGKQDVGETKRHLHQRFGEYRRSILNYGHFSNPTPVSEHFNQADHSINDVLLIPLELIHSNRKAHLIDKAMTLEPQGINRRDELN
ncbi:unnamed protein product, partial [Porites evermanni]